MDRVRKAIIPAAGLGTRFLPTTKAMPKEMLPIVDKPTIQYIVEEAVQSGIEEIMIVSGRSKRVIEDHFDKNFELEIKLKEKNNVRMLQVLDEITNLGDIHFVRQREPLGLGHAIWCARKFVGDEPFAILLGDIIIQSEVPCLKKLIDKYKEHGGASVIAIQSVPEDEVSKYGVIDGDPIGENMHLVRHLVEKPQQNPPSQLAIIGRYVLTPAIFDILEHTKPGAGGEIQLTDALNKLAIQEKLLAYLYEGRLYDVGNKLGFLMATVEYAYKNEELSEAFDQYIRAFLAEKNLRNM